MLRSSRILSGSPLFFLAILMLVATFASAQYTHYTPDGDQIPGPDCLQPKRPVDGLPKPCTAEDYKAWLDDVTHWRNEARIRAGYSDHEYERPELKWTQSSFMQPQMMVEDRYFYDAEAGRYTVEATIGTSEGMKKAAR